LDRRRYAPCAAIPIMLSMTSAASAPRRVILVPKARTTVAADAPAPALRRYSLARLAASDRCQAADPHAHLKRVYD
jgi:hypothetical protein